MGKRIFHRQASAKAPKGSRRCAAVRALVLILIVTLAGCAAWGGFYNGAYADAVYDTSWDPQAAASAIAALGGQTYDMRHEPDASSLFLGHATLDNETLTFAVRGDGWILRQVFDTPGGEQQVDSEAEAKAELERDRLAFEPVFSQLVAAFDAELGVAHQEILWTVRFGSS